MNMPDMGIATADNQISKQLKRDPIALAVELLEGLLRMVCNPLAVYFSVEEKRVIIEAVGWVN